MKTAYGVILALIILLASCKGSTSTSPPRAWVVSTLAGDGTAGNQDDTATTTARFSRPTGVAVDSSGNVYVADSGNHRIRRIKITPGEGQEEDTVEVSTIAGSGTTGGYQEGVGTSARFNFPYGVAVDSLDNVYVADRDNNRFRKITKKVDDAGDETWTVSTFAGGAQGHVEGDAADARFWFPQGVAVDESDNVYVADTGNERIRKITETEKVDNDGNKIWKVSTLAGDGTYGYRDGTAAKFNSPYGVAVDESGNVYVADLVNHRIRKITKEVDNDGNKIWKVSTLAGSTSGYQDGAAARFNQPYGVAVDESGNVYVADLANHRIRKITETEEVDNDGNKIWKVSTLAGSGTRGYQDGTAAQFDWPAGVAVDESGNVYVAERSNHRIRKIEYRVP